MKQEVTKRLPAENLAEPARCSVIATLKLFATKWKPCILCYLSSGALRYNELQRAIPNISRKMLSEHLRELEQDQLIIRHQYDPKNQRVEYALSDLGRSLLGILTQLQDWGMEHLAGVTSIRDMLNLHLQS
jgi:DNA-binding HxlR family transcriptional regulator